MEGNSARTSGPLVSLRFVPRQSPWFRAITKLFLECAAIHA